jgi:hypothetical protein
MKILVSLPLVAFGASRRRKSSEEVVVKMRDVSASPVPRSTFHLVMSAVALNAFVNFGLGAIFIEFLKAEGCRRQRRSGFGSMLGVIQVGARV